MSGWDLVVPVITDDDRKRVIEDVSGQLKNLSLAEMRGDREKLIARVTPLVQTSVSRLSLQMTPDQARELAREVVARVGGLGFLEPLLRVDSGLSEIAVTPDGGIWVLRKGQGSFEKLPIAPSHTDVWRGNGNLARSAGPFSNRSVAFCGREDSAPGRTAWRSAR